MRRKGVFDILFITVSALFLLVINYYKLAETYLTFSLIPLMTAYYLGKYIGGKQSY